jgi:hypothetical protein
MKLVRRDYIRCDISWILNRKRGIARKGEVVSLEIMTEEKVGKLRIVYYHPALAHPPRIDRAGSGGVTPIAKPPMGVPFGVAVSLRGIVVGSSGMTIC